MPKCGRCGQCCETFAISISPQEIKKSYYSWKKDNRKFYHYKDIDLLYPMLIYTGYDRKKGKYRYKCRFLEKDKKGKATCVIQDIKPTVCKSYGQRDRLDLHEHHARSNKGLYPKCVF